MTRKPAEKPDEAPATQLSLEARFAPTPPPAKPPSNMPASAPTVPVSAIPAGEPAAGVPAEPRVYRVAELLRATRLTLESRFADVRVEGEVSGLKRSGPGHIYFSLKDAEAALDCVMFSREASRLKFSIEEGMAVRCRGRLTLYEARGKFQMSVVEVEPTGAGALALAFEQLKQRLGAEGLFDPARKRPLPFLPRRLGVVTSASGAVIRDIVRVAHRRAALPILLMPTPVQGEGAAIGIAAAIRRLEAVADVDVIIVARGGGSLEDLWAFNEEPVARAIVACRVPVISAVGHETDFTIADFVADVRAATPSAAAALAVPVFEDLKTELRLLQQPRRARAGRAARGARATSWSGRARASAIRAGCSTSGGNGWTIRWSAGGACSRGGSPRRTPSCAPPRRGFTARTRTAASASSAAPWRRCATGWRRRCGRRWSAAATRSRGRAASWRRCRPCGCWSAASASRSAPTATW